MKGEREWILAMILEFEIDTFFKGSCQGRWTRNCENKKAGDNQKKESMEYGQDQRKNKQKHVAHDEKQLKRQQGEGLK
jgi:hypothetical protein